MLTTLLDPTGYSFDPFAALSATTGILCLALGIAGVVRERGSRTSWSFFLLCLTIWVWLAAFSLMYLATDREVAYTWAKTAYLGIPLIAPAVYHFATRVLEIQERRRWVVWPAWAVFAGFVALFTASEHLFGELRVFVWGFYPSLEPAALAFVVPFVGLLGLSLWEFRESYRRAESRSKKARERALLVGFAVAYLALVDYLPAFGVEVYPVGFLAVTAFLAIVAAAIWKYRLADLTPAFVADRLIRTMPDMLLVCDDRGRVRFVNPAVSRILHYGIGELTGEPVRALADEEASRDILDILLREAAGFDRELALRARNGEAVKVSVSASELRDEGGLHVGNVLVARDIRERERMRGELIRRALYDHLTGLPNRTLLLERIERVLAHRRRQGEPFAVLYLGIDDFEAVADSLGLHAADEALAAVGRRIAASVREADTVARVEGAQFAILLRYASGVEDAVRAARRMQEVLSPPLVARGQQLFLGASLGIAVVGADYEDGEEILRDAQTALHRAKERGHGKIELFDRELRARAARRLALEGELRRALKEGELRLRYQPIVSLEDGRTRGYEALLRWRHPERGLLGPAEFLEVAEESGLIVHIGAQTLRRACRQLRRWEAASPKLGDLQLHVNLSTRELARPELTEGVEKVLEEQRIAPDRLVLEITETALMERSERILRTLSVLRVIGVRFALDDFGTGYSSLAYLHHLPVEILKIDRSFVAGVRDGGEVEISRAILSLGNGMGMEVIAEGVETAGQLMALGELGCRYAQGDYLAPPLDPDEVGLSLHRRVERTVRSALMASA